MNLKLHVSACCLLAGTFGCGGTEVEKPQYGGDLVPVVGTVTVDGEPADSVIVTFTPVVELSSMGQRMTTGVTDAEGVYTLTSPPGGANVDPQEYKGALPGKYQVSFNRFLLDDGKAWNPVTAEESPLNMGATESMPGYLTNPETSRIMVTVEADGGSHDFDLKTKKKR